MTPMAQIRKGEQATPYTLAALLAILALGLWGGCEVNERTGPKLVGLPSADDFVSNQWLRPKLWPPQVRRVKGEVYQVNIQIINMGMEPVTDQVRCLVPPSSEYVWGSLQVDRLGKTVPLRISDDWKWWVLTVELTWEPNQVHTISYRAVAGGGGSWEPF